MTTDITQPKTLAELETAHAALSAELARARATDDAAGHFFDETGAHRDHPDEMVDAMLRSMGVAMDKRARTLGDLFAPDEASLASAAASALSSKNYVDAGLYLAALHAKAAIASRSFTTTTTQIADAARAEQKVIDDAKAAAEAAATA